MGKKRIEESNLQTVRMGRNTVEINRTKCKQNKKELKVFNGRIQKKDTQNKGYGKLLINQLSCIDNS